MEYEWKRCGQLWYHLLWKLLALGFLSFPFSQVETAGRIDPDLTVWMRKHPVSWQSYKMKGMWAPGCVEWSCPTHQVKEKWTCILFKFLYCWFLHDGSLARTPRNTPVLGPLGFHSWKLFQLTTHLIVGGSWEAGLDCTMSSFKVHLKNYSGPKLLQFLCGFNLYDSLTYVKLTNIFLSFSEIQHFLLYMHFLSHM